MPRYRTHKTKTPYFHYISASQDRKKDALEFSQRELRGKILYCMLFGPVHSLHCSALIFCKLAPRHLVHIVFGRSLDKMCKKWQYLAQNDQKCRFWTKFGRFWAKNPNLYFYLLYLYSLFEIGSLWNSIVHQI